MGFKKFEEIKAWQKGRELTREVYTASRDGAFAKDFGLKDQVRRAGVSVMLNIAEGASRPGDKEFAQFLGIARGSAAEVQSALYVALDQEYLVKEEFDRLYSLADECSKMIQGLSSYLRGERN